MGFPTTAPDIPLSTIGELLSNLGGGAGLIPHLNKIRTEILAIAAKYGTGAGAAAANTVLRGTGAGTSAFGAVETADLVADAISAVYYDAGAGDTNTGTAGTLANITSTVVTPTLNAGGKGLAFVSASFTDTVSAADVSLGINIGGTDHWTGLPLFAMPTAGQRAQGHWMTRFTGLSGATTFQGRFGRGGAAGTLTVQQSQIVVIEFQK